MGAGQTTEMYCASCTLKVKETVDSVVLSNERYDTNEAILKSLVISLPLCKDTRITLILFTFRESGRSCLFKFSFN